MRDIRQKMPPGQRAKQFMPFAALKGLEEALARQEKKAAEKKSRRGGSPGGEGASAPLTPES